MDSFQLSLFDFKMEPITAIDGSDLSNEEKFNRFHKENEHVYHTIMFLIRQAQQSGMTKWGMKGIFELMRWQWYMQTRGQNGDYKLNNIYTSFYADLVIKNNPSLKTFLERRQGKRKRDLGD